MSASCRPAVSGVLPHTPTVVQPVPPSVCSHWKQNMSGAALTEAAIRRGACTVAARAARGAACRRMRNAMLSVRRRSSEEKSCVYQEERESNKRRKKSGVEWVQRVTGCPKLEPSCSGLADAWVHDAISDASFRRSPAFPRPPLPASGNRHSVTCICAAVCHQHRGYNGAQVVGTDVEETQHP